MRELPVSVPSTASYTGLPWATFGFGLFQAVEPSGRRWFLPRPVGDLSGFTTRAISNTESSWVARLVLAKLRVPAYDMDTGLWGASANEYLLEGDWPRIWSTHSERASLVSLLATAGVGRDERNLIGRWAPEGSDDYVRTYRQAAKRLVDTAVGIERDEQRSAEADEEEILYNGAKRLVEAGVLQVPP